MTLDAALNGTLNDVQTDVQNLFSAADFFLFKRWKYER